MALCKAEKEVRVTKIWNQYEVLLLMRAMQVAQYLCIYMDMYVNTYTFHISIYVSIYI